MLPDFVTVTSLIRKETDNKLNRASVALAIVGFVTDSWTQWPGPSSQNT